MNKKAETTVEKSTYAVLIFLFVVVCLITLNITILQDNNITPSDDYQDLLDVVDEDSNLYEQIEFISRSQDDEDPLDNESSYIKRLIGKVKQSVDDRLEDSMFFQAYKTAKTVSAMFKAVKANINTFLGFITFGNLWIANIIKLFVLLSVVFAVVYFARRGR